MKNRSFVFSVHMAKVNKNSKYLEPVERGRISHSTGVLDLNFGQINGHPSLY